MKTLPEEADRDRRETLDGGAVSLGVPGGVWLKMERNSEAAPPGLT